MSNRRFTTGPSAALPRRVGVAALGLLGGILASCSSEPASPVAPGPSPSGGSTMAAGGSTSTTGGTPATTGGTPATTGGTPATTGGTPATTGGTPATTGGTPATTGGTPATTGGTAGSGGTSPGGPLGPSAGCMKAPPAESPGERILHSIDVNGMDAKYVAGYTHRKYCTTIPPDYDAQHPYPVVFYGPGCGATACEGNNFAGRNDIFIVQAIAGADAKGANLVPQNGAPGCFQAGKEGTGDSPEGPYFDQVMAEVAATYCIDTSKVFAAGTSSGAWLSNYLACARGGAVRGTVADSGGLQFDHGVCRGGAAVMNMPGDATSAHDQEGHEIGAGQARDMFIQLNGCSMTPTQMTFGGSTCDFYGGCSSPVVWCNVGGGHQSGNGKLSAVGWAFWSTLQ